MIKLACEETVKVELTMDQFCWLCNSLGTTPKQHFRFHEDLDELQWGNMLRRVLADGVNGPKLTKWCDEQIKNESEGDE